MNDEDRNEDMNIGLFLKLARERKSLSIDAISRHTKISSTNLEYLESNNKAALPNIAYVKGFVKSYCKIVDIELDYALSLLDELYQITPEKTEVVEQVKIVTELKNKATIQTEPKSYANIYKATTAILLLVVAIGIITTRQSESLKDEETVTQEESEIVSPQSLSKSSPLQADEPQEIIIKEEVKETPEEVVKVAAPEPVKVAAPEPVKAAEVVKKEKIELKDEIEFYNFPFPLYKIAANSKDEISFIPENYRKSLASDSQNVFITAIDGDSWITYKKDSDPVKKFVLKQGRYIMIRGNDIRLFLGNVNATKVFLNNDLLDITSTSSVKSLVFPQELSKKLKLPLFVFKKDGTAITSEEYIIDSNE